MPETSHLSEFQRQMRRFLAALGDPVAEFALYDGHHGGVLTLEGGEWKTDPGNKLHIMHSRMAQSAAFAAIRRAESIEDLERLDERSIKIECPWWDCCHGFYCRPIRDAHRYAMNHITMQPKVHQHAH